MSRAHSAKAVRCLGVGFLVLVAFEACSTDSSPVIPAGPQTISISRISLGTGAIGQGGDSGVLACDDTVDVSLAITNWTFLEPGKCDTTLQCGQVKVSLFGDIKQPALASQVAVSAGVALNLKAAGITAGNYVIQAALITDSDHVYSTTNGGTSTAQQSFSLSLPAGGACEGGAASVGGADNEGGMGGAPFFENGGAGGDGAGAGGAPAP